MDAKAGDWVVTPRRGKAVEINALWYNALRLVADWFARTGDADGAARCARAPIARTTSFNRRFWNERTGYLYDVVDGEHGDDPSHAARTSCSRSRCRTRCSIRRAGTRCSTSSSASC